MAHKTLTISEKAYEALAELKKEGEKFEKATLEARQFDNSAALKAADIQAGLMNSGRPVNILDTLIAAIVITNNEVLLTRNIDHFGRIPGLNYSSW